MRRVSTRQPSLRFVVVLGAAVLVAAGGVGAALSNPAVTAHEHVALDEKIQHVATVDGDRWTMKSYANARDDYCFSQSVPGEGVGHTCTERAEMFANGREVLLVYGARQLPGDRTATAWRNMWIQGVASPRVAALELVMLDCSVRRIALDADQTFMYVVNRNDIARDEVPYRLIARDVDGGAIWEQSVRVGLPDTAVRAGVKPASPGRSCA